MEFSGPFVPEEAAYVVRVSGEPGVSRFRALVCFSIELIMLTSGRSHCSRGGVQHDSIEVHELSRVKPANPDDN